MRLFRKMKNAIKDPKQAKKLSDWKRKYNDAKNKYSDDLAKMREYESLYDGDRSVNVNPNKGKGKAAKVSINVRNITYELIESQVDSSIPMPKVTPIHQEDEELAKIIEIALQNEIRMLHFNVLNDKSERTVPIQGGDFMHVEWDNTKGYHCTIGGVSVSERHPRTVIPQPGITEIEEMDYIFVLIPQTKEFIKRKYNVDVSEASDTETDLKSDSKRDDNDEIVTVVKCYYRNNKGSIGLFSWCEEFILEDYEDYQARRLLRCVKCGRVKDSDVCECGSKKFEERAEEFEELQENITLRDGKLIEAVKYRIEPLLDENDKQLTDENGEPLYIDIEERTKIPYYKPDDIPIILRRNVSREGKLLGFSDVAVISDQQDAIKKLGSKLQEKILKGGSLVMLPFGSKIATDDNELKVVRVKNANEASLIGVKNLQADISMDRVVMNDNYEAAKSTLGITDAYQGKYDSSATSGTAKQYSINQAAGRLESKRVMKNTAYAKLYEMIFKHLLAYADQPIPMSMKNSDGAYEYAHFNRFDFLKRDAAGEFYWDDEFIFETDPTSTIMMNREAMWQQIDLKYQAGAFGPISGDQTLLTYWTFMEQNDYPNSAAMKKIFSERVQQNKAMQEQMAQQQMMQQQMMQQMGGVQNAMPLM